MKSSKVIGYIGAVTLGGLGVATAVTNPSPPNYEAYAVQRLTEYIKSEVCTKAPKAFGDFLRSNCTSLVDSTQPGIGRIITANTRRQNYIFFSIYTTDLSVSSMIPSYHFETVGALQNFYTYKAQER
jgi:hypothetical protein